MEAYLDNSATTRCYEEVADVVRTQSRVRTVDEGLAIEHFSQFSFQGDRCCLLIIGA